MTIASLTFLDATLLFSLVDHELELVEPHERFLDDLLTACHHPLTRQHMPAQARTSRDHVLSFLNQNPRGHTLGDPDRGLHAGYTFWMRIHPARADRSNGNPPPPPGIAGSISLRIGHSVNLDRYLGHIGYHVLPPFRGHHFAERASRLLLPLARAHGHRLLWITCNPDNVASRRTCERLPATLVDTVPVPRDNALYAQGDRHKCRFRVDL